MIDEDREIPGYRSTVHFSLLVIARLKGVPYRPAVVNLLGTMILSLMWQTLAFIPIAAFVHVSLQYLTKDDPYAVGKVLRSWKHPACFYARGKRRHRGAKQLRESIYARPLPA